MRRRCQVYGHCSHCPQPRREHCWGANGFPDNQQRGPIYHCLQETYHMRLLNAKSMKAKGKRSRPQGLGIGCFNASSTHSHFFTCIKISPRLVSRSAQKTIEYHPRSPHSLRILMEQQHCDHTPGQRDDQGESRGLPSCPNGCL